MNKSTLNIRFLSKLLCLSIIILFPNDVAGNNDLSTTYSSVLSEILPAPMTFAPVPVAKDNYWRTGISLEIRNDYIKYGETYKGCKWDSIDNDLFAEYRQNGNRTNYERKSFTLRRQLAALVLAEIVEYKGRFIIDITKGLHYFIHETWWGIPAHYPTAQPKYDNQIVDLFNAETANLLAWTTYMLHDELENVELGLC